MDKVRLWCDRAGFFTMKGWMVAVCICIGQDAVFQSQVVLAQEHSLLEETVDIGVDRLKALTEIG